MKLTGNNKLALLIIFWRSNVKVTSGRRGDEDIHIEARGVEDHLLAKLVSSSPPKQNLWE